LVLLRSETKRAPFSGSVWPIGAQTPVVDSSRGQVRGVGVAGARHRLVDRQSCERRRGGNLQGVVGRACDDRPREGGLERDAGRAMQRQGQGWRGEGSAQRARGGPAAEVIIRVAADGVQPNVYRTDTPVVFDLSFEQGYLAFELMLLPEFDRGLDLFRIERNPLFADLHQRWF
jgi:hypothetical protein